jgi:hypothetical protein
MILMFNLNQSKGIMFLQKYYQISVQGIVISQRIKTVLQLMVSGKVEAGNF